MARPLSTYAFLNAKLKARIAMFLGEEKLEALIRANSLPEAFLLLRDTGYRDLEAAYTATADFRSAEAILVEKEGQVLLDLTQWAREPVLSFFRTLTIRFEVDKVKNILRLWFNAAVRGGDVLEKAAFIDRKSLLHPLNIDSILSAGSWEDVSASFSGTIYAAIIMEELPVAVKERNLFKMELALDRLYFDMAFLAAERLSPRDRKTAHRSLVMDVNAQNADRLMRFGNFQGIGDIREYLIPYGDITGTKGIPQSQTEGDLSTRPELMRKALQSMAITEAKKFLAGDPFSIGIPLAYASLKQEEIRNILTILSGKNMGISEERIRAAL